MTTAIGLQSLFTLLCVVVNLLASVKMLAILLLIKLILYRSDNKGMSFLDVSFFKY